MLSSNKPECGIESFRFELGDVVAADLYIDIMKVIK